MYTAKGKVFKKNPPKKIMKCFFFFLVLFFFPIFFHMHSTYARMLMGATAAVAQAEDQDAPGASYPLAFFSEDQDTPGASG